MSIFISTAFSANFANYQRNVSVTSAAMKRYIRRFYCSKEGFDQFEHLSASQFLTDKAS